MSNQVARTILAQLGGGRFLAMTGAKDLTGSHDSLSMKLGRFAGLKVTHLRVTLDASDTYTMKFMRYSRTKLEMETLETVEGVYCEDLQRIFTAKTGLYTSLGRAA